MTSWLRARLASYGERPALVDSERTTTYAQLTRAVATWDARLEAAGVGTGSTVGLLADYGSGAVAALVACVIRGAVVLPLTSAVAARHDEFLSIARARHVVRIGAGGEVDWSRREVAGSSHPLLDELRRRGTPGLVLFSSGSTGEPKASLLDFGRLLEKFEAPRPAYRSLTFLLLDHIGGINTLMYLLSNGGAVVPLRDRRPRAVCEAIERHRVQLLPTTPTFLNMLLISGAYQAHDLSSLELITYGTEPMPASTLRQLHAALPHVRLKQTYGLSELGILRTRSRSADSLWVKVGGEGYETKVVDGTLRIRARAAMLGYLNAPSPFDAEGWFDTGDRVEVDGEYLRILGRTSDIINVGGEKVFAAEVESVLLEVPGVTDAVVMGRPNPVTGQVVTAKVALAEPEGRRALRRRVRAFCAGKLEDYKIPVHVEVEDGLHNARFKRRRGSAL